MYESKYLSFLTWWCSLFASGNCVERNDETCAEIYAIRMQLAFYACRTAGWWRKRSQRKCDTSGNRFRIVILDVIDVFEAKDRIASAERRHVYSVCNSGEIFRQRWRFYWRWKNLCTRWIFVCILRLILCFLRVKIKWKLKKSNFLHKNQKIPSIWGWFYAFLQVKIK